MKFRFVWIGETRDPQYLKLEERYLRRLRRFVPVERTSIPEQKKRDRHQRAAQLEREARLIEEKLPSATFLVVLDQGGQQFSSLELSQFVRKLINRGSSDVTFLIGGHQGLPRRLFEVANLRLSLSPMTLPHELARVILFEQLYRSMTILRGLPYHK